MFVGDSINPGLEMDSPVTYTCGNGKEIKAELKDVQVNEKFNFNLFSVTRMLQKGYTLKGDAKSITLEKGNHAFVFDIVIWTRGGVLYRTVQDSVETRTLLCKTETWHLWCQIRQKKQLRKQKKP